MTAEEIKSLPVAEKIQILETIWADLHERFEAAELSPRIKQLLDERRERVRTGAVQILDWDSVKDRIGRP